MLRSAAVSRIQQTLGFRSDKSAEIILALQDVQVQLEKGKTLPFFLKTEVQNRNTVSGEERVPIPTDFIREYDEDPLWYFNGSAADVEDVWTSLAKDDLQVLRDTYPGEGAPKAYHLDHLYYRIFPTPDAAYNLKHIFYKNDMGLSSDIENLWLEHEPWLLIGMAGQMISGALSNDHAFALFQKWETEGRARMFGDTQARQHNSRRYIMGGPD